MPISLLDSLFKKFTDRARSGEKRAIFFQSSNALFVSQTDLLHLHTFSVGAMLEEWLLF